MFSQNFSFQLPALVNFVGGGGKTGLILKLAEEYAAGIPVVYTTTTRIHPPHPKGGMTVLSSDNPAWLHSILETVGRQHSMPSRIFVITDLPMAPRLLRGVSPDFAASINREVYPIILNEADGARSMSIKLPRDGEPVLMEGADYLVPVIGLDCVNQPLGPETLFRWEIAEGPFNLKRGQTLTPKLAADLLLHPRGVCKGWRAGTRIVTFINKADSPKDDDLARELGRALINDSRFPVSRVVYGSLMKGRAAVLEAG